MLPESCFSLALWVDNPIQALASPPFPGGLVAALMDQRGMDRLGREQNNLIFESVEN